MLQRLVLPSTYLENVEVKSKGLVDEVQGPRGNSHSEGAVQDLTVELSLEQLRLPHLLHLPGHLESETMQASFSKPCPCNFPGCTKGC